MLLLVVAGLAVAGCSRSEPVAFTTQATNLQAPKAPAEVVLAPVPPVGPISFTATAFDLHAAGRVDPAASDAARAGVLDTLNRYLEAAVLEPLRSGGPAGDLTPLFTSPAVERVMAGPDRFAFIDENLPAVSDLRQEAAAAGLNALAGPDGIMSVVTADLDLRLIGHVAGAPVSVVRTGELVLVPEGGTWRIDAYDIRVTRTVGTDTTSTTVRS